MLLIERTGTRLSDLAERAQITKQAMMQIVDDLEAAGSVRRTGCSRSTCPRSVSPSAKVRTRCGAGSHSCTTSTSASGFGAP